MMEYIDLVVSLFKIIVSNFYMVLYWYLDALYRFVVPPPMKSIDGEVILVTGANSGIGREMCRYIVEKCGENIELIMWDLDLSELSKFAEELKLIGKEFNNQIFCYEVDISTRENIDEGYEKVKSECGPVTIIFNNAAIAPNANFLQMTNETVNKIINVNLTSHFWIIRNFLPDMVANNHGRIVNVSSLGAIWGGHHNFPYFASKFGGHGLMESLKIELEMKKLDGIFCSMVYPAFVQTPLVSSLYCDENKSLMPNVMCEFLDADKVAIKIVDGVRREYEYIYLPPMIQVLRFLEYFLPRKMMKFVFMTHASSYAYRNKEEQKRIFDAPFEPYTVTNELYNRRG